MDEIYIKKEDVERWIGKYFPNKELISVDDLIACIEDLDSKIQSLKEDYEELEQQIEDNYKPIDPYEQYNVSESWFH